MKRLGVALALSALLVLPGCKAPEAAGEVRDKIVVIAESIEAAEPVVAALEKATGGTLPIEVAIKGEEISNQVEVIAKRAGAAAAVVSAIPGPQQPIAGGLAVVLGALGTLAGAVGAFFHQRRKAQNVAHAAVMAAETMPGGGNAIVEAAEDAGADELIRASYAAAIAAGDIG